MELDSRQGGALESDQELVLQPGSPPAPQLPANDVASMPGFRFQPTEEELVGFYLRSMVMGNRLEVDLINVLNLYRYDPWELPAMAFMQGEREWLFFCPRDKKYPNGARPNRVTNSGYWKATGTDRPVRRADDARCIGLKKTLVFYTGKAPRGRKTEWIMNEYRLPQHEHTLCLKSLHHFHLNTTTTDVDRKEVALCRIYKKPYLISATANLFADSSVPDVVDSPKRVKVADGHNNVKLESNSSSNAMGYKHGPWIPAAQCHVWSPAVIVPDQRFMQAHRGERSMDRLNWADCFGGEERVASAGHNQLGDLGPTISSIDRLLKASMWSPLPPLNLDCGGALMKRDCGDDIVASVGSVSAPVLPSLTSMSSQFV